VVELVKLALLLYWPLRGQWATSVRRELLNVK
jgi:hypothetical protein